jgi:hypothetical protein
VALVEAVWGAQMNQIASAADEMAPLVVSELCAVEVEIYSKVLLQILILV